jgi:5-methyltetrahydrofolate--homocysteine methyltransferase
METIVSSATKEVLISDGGPTRLIGERIDPSGKKKLAEALKNGYFAMICREAIAQAEAGADILDINAVTPGVDEISVLPQVVERIMASVDVPLCLDINKPAALRKTLEVYKGKPIINSVTGEEKSLNEILPLARNTGRWSLP